MILGNVCGTRAGLRRCKVLGLGLSHVRPADRSLFVADGRGGHQRVVPVSNTFFAAVGDYLRWERPPDTETDWRGRADGAPRAGGGRTIRSRISLTHADGSPVRLRRRCSRREELVDEGLGQPWLVATGLPTSFDDEESVQLGRQKGMDDVGGVALAEFGP